MKRKLLGVCLTVALVTTLGLVTALPTGAADTYVAYELGADTNSTALWDATEKEFGAYSANLTYKSGDSNAYIEFIPQTAITMDDLDSIVEEWSYWYHSVTQTTGGPNMELLFTEPGYNPSDGFGRAEVNVQVEVNFTADVWAEEDAVTNATVYTYYYVPSDGTEGTVGLSGDPNDPPPITLGETLAAIDADDEMVADSASAATWELTRVRMEIGWGGPDRTCYIDDVTIDGVTYGIEPFAAFDDYYMVGDTISVTVYNANANDPMAIDTLTIAAESDTDTVGDTAVTLTETGSDTGVFTGGITLVRAAPANRANDEIVVSDEDTVTITLTGDWGAGSQPLTTTATVDDTAPVIVIVSPAVSANITDVTPEIKATYTDVGSGSDNTTAVMKVNGSVVAFSANTTAITYTPGTALTDGSYAVTVAISDVAGNAATQASWSFKVDTVDPVISGQAATPAVVSPTVSANITFTATVADATSGVDTVTIDVSFIDSATDLAMTDGGGGVYSVTVATSVPITEATYLLAVTATDEATNSVSANITLGVWSDIIDPVISSPAITYLYGLNSAPPGGTVTISANVTDAGGMGTVTAACTAFTGTASLLDDGNTPDATADDDVYTGTATVASVASGDYDISIAATDAKGNVATPDTSLTLTVAAAVTGFEIELEEGWNLISLPLIPDDSDITVVISATTLASANVTSVVIIRGYDPATEIFSSYMPSTGGDLDEMVDGVGYWVFMDSADTLTVTGREWPVPPDVPHTYDVVVGWNLIGFKSLEDAEDTDYLVSFTAYPVLWSYDAVTGQYSNVKGGTMLAGHGFWLWALEVGTIVPPE